MKREDMDILAAEFVLGTLESEARRDFSAELATDPGLQELVGAWETRLVSLGAAGTPVEPPSDVWRGIEGALDKDARPEPASRTVRGSEGIWVDFAEGVKKKLLSVDRSAGVESYLLRFAPGAELPPHEHGMAEECLMLEGEAMIGSLRLTAGDYHVIAAGAPHPMSVSESGCLVFVRGEVGELAV